MSRWDVDQTKFAAEMRYARMVGNAKDFSDAIGTFLQSNASPFHFQIFEGATHNTAPWGAVNTVLQFLYGYGDGTAEPQSPRK